MDKQNTNKIQRKDAWQLHSEATLDQFASPEISLGPWSSYSMRTDPKHIVFVLSRYKFVQKMLEGKRNVLEIGCGDGIGALLIGQISSLDNLVCIDWDKRNIQGNNRRLLGINSKIQFAQHDTNQSPYVNPIAPNGFDAAFMIDVIEHVEPEREKDFIRNICKALNKNGILITGTPNRTSAMYASAQSNSQHINLKSHDELRETMFDYFEHVFSFGMNDEVIHTGFGPMCHYIWTIAISPKG